MGLKSRIRKFLKKFFDYRIVGEYYDNDGKGHRMKKYMKKYFIRKNHNY